MPPARQPIMDPTTPNPPSQNLLQKFKNIRFSPEKIGYLLLLVAFLLGCLTVYANIFVDEADNLVVGKYLSQGAVLYQDVFSHHFPFPYYWVAVVIGIFGKSLFFVRLSVWAFQAAAFALVIRLSRFPIQVGLTALIWALMRHYYWGNMLLYDVFSTTSLFVLGAITLTLLEKKEPANLKTLFLIAAFTSISLLSDPRSVYTIALLFIFIFVTDLKTGLKASVLTAAILACFVLYLLFNGTFNNFIQDAILFNFQVYGKYTSTSNPVGLSVFGTNLLRFLGIARPQWFNLNPLYQLAYDETFDYWVFTGFLYRAGFVLSALLLLSLRKFRQALFVYTYAASLLAISSSDFHGQPFVLAAVFVLSMFVTLRWSGSDAGLANRFILWSYSFFRIGLALMLAWLMIRVTVNLVSSPDVLMPETGFSKVFENLSRVQKLSCGQKNVRLLVYPGGQDAYLYWFTEFKPVTKYLYLWPWIADIGLSDTLQALERPDGLVIVVREKRTVIDYLAELQQYLNRQYSPAFDNMYISPALAQKCGLPSK